VLPQGGGFCNNPWLNFHVKKYSNKVMGHVFQAKWRGKHLGGCHFQFIMAKEIGKGINKGKEALLNILLMKIKEIRRKGK